MPRPRKPGQEWFPPRVYLEKGRYYWRADDGTEVKLAPASATRDAVLKAYVALPKEAAAPAAMTLREFLTEYEGSQRFRKKLTYGTQLDAIKAFKMLCRTKLKDGRQLGDLAVLSLTPVIMQRWFDKRGETSENRANKELSYGSKAFQWGIPRAIGSVTANPFAGIERYEQVERDRYVTHEEYDQRAELCVELGRPDIMVMMEIAYLCRLREHEILKILDSPTHTGDVGVLAQRGKGSKTQIIGWTERLEAAVALARYIKASPRWEMKRQIKTLCLVTSAVTGYPMTIATLGNAWNDIRAEAIKRGHAGADTWTFHDLKAKGVTDFEGDKHKASGHKTQRMTNLYNRLPEVVKATDSMPNLPAVVAKLLARREEKDQRSAS